MPELGFEVVGAEPQLYAAAPALHFRLRVSNTPADEQIQTIALRCQIQIEPARRQYAASEQERLLDLFGEVPRWGQTIRPALWTHAAAVVTPFQAVTETELPVPCTFDFNVASTKYFAGLDDGEVPLCLQFSGTVFYEPQPGQLQIAQIPWDRETRYRLPVRVWKEMMQVYYPNTAWLCLRRDVFDLLYQFKVRRGLPTWEQTVEALLAGNLSGAER